MMPHTAVLWRLGTLQILPDYILALVTVYTRYCYCPHIFLLQSCPSGGSCCPSVPDALAPASHIWTALIASFLVPLPHSCLPIIHDQPRSQSELLTWKSDHEPSLVRNPAMVFHLELNAHSLPWPPHNWASTLLLTPLHTTLPLDPYPEPQQLSYTSRMLQGLAVHLAPSRILCHVSPSQRNPSIEHPVSKATPTPSPVLFFSKHHYIRSNLIHVYMCALNDCFQILHTSSTLNQCGWQNFLWWWKCSIPVLPDTTATSLLSTWNVTSVTEEVNF